MIILHLVRLSNVLGSRARENANRGRKGCRNSGRVVFLDGWEATRLHALPVRHGLGL